MFGAMRKALLALCLAACGGGSSKPVAKPEPKPDPVVVDDDKKEPPEPPKPTREEQIAAALARVPDIRAKVSELRGLPSTDVPAATQTVEDFEAFVRKEAAEEMTPEEAAKESRALAHLGVLETEVDLIEASIDTAVSQVAAYYDPDVKHFQVVQVPEDDQSFDMVSAHELTHAVQDQNFDLKAFMPLDLSDDAGNARRFLVEGDATLMMLIYLVSAQTGVDATTQAPVMTAIGQQIDMLANMSAAEIGAMMGGKDADPAAAAAAALPPWIIVPMFDSYMKGARVVLKQHMAGGWDGVNALYKTPPTTTEQMLHPAEKLVCHREEPTKVTVPAGAEGKGWTKLADGVLGELGLRIYGQVWKLPDANAFASGWNGDAWRVSEKGDQRLGMLATAWDTVDEAKEFAAGVEASLTTRNVKGQVAVKGDRVDVVIGCDGKACKAPLAAMAKAHAKAKPAAARKVDQKETDCLAALK